MASEQVEYCGNCEHYAYCKALALRGCLMHCKANDEK